MAKENSIWLIIGGLVIVYIIIQGKEGALQAVVPTTDNKCLKSDVANPGLYSSWKSSKWLSVDRDNDGDLDGFGYNAYGSSTQNTCSQIYSKYGLITAVSGVAETNFKGDIYVYKGVDTPDPYVIVCRDSTGNLASFVQFRVNSPYYSSADTSACGSSCANECAAVGATKCSGNGYITCGNYDADLCLEFGTTVTPCQSGCISGKCVGNCNTEADTNCDGKVSETELLAYGSKWIKNEISETDLLKAGSAWIAGG